VDGILIVAWTSGVHPITSENYQKALEAGVADNDIFATISLDDGTTWLPYFIVDDNGLTDSEFSTDSRPRTISDWSGGWWIVWNRRVLIPQPDELSTRLRRIEPPYHVMTYQSNVLQGPGDDDGWVWFEPMPFVAEPATLGLCGHLGTLLPTSLIHSVVVPVDTNGTSSIVVR